jgi:hypothetical protein
VESKLQVPSPNSLGAEKVQDCWVEVAVNVHNFVVEPEVAEIVTSAPTTRPPTEIDGVVSEVTLSLVRPNDAGEVSELASRSGVEGTLIAIGPAESLSLTVEPTEFVPVATLRIYFPTSAAAST